MAPSQDSITEPLREHGLSPSDVTDVVISHHHPDHTINVGLFPQARIHDHWAIYDFRGRWDTLDCEGREVSPNVQLIKTPGHSAEDLSTVVQTADGVCVVTHEWWNAEVPVDDPYAPDLDAAAREPRANPRDRGRHRARPRPAVPPDESTPR